MNLLSWLVYIPLQIAAIPINILGAVIVAYYQILVSKRLGVSMTAIEIFNGRWTLHMFGMRDDPGAAKLAPALPNTSTRGLWLAFFPLWVKAKIAGHPAIYPRILPDEDAGIPEMVPNRTVAFDRVLSRRLRVVEQFVVMGAGMDTRAYGALDLGGARVFELDQAATQHVKRAALDKAGIDSTHVTFVEVDFSKEDPFDKLKASGFDPAARTLFLWEGVTLYLSEQAVRDTLANVRANFAPGSAIVVDIYGERMMAMARRSGARQTLDLTGEGLEFSMSFAKDWDDELAAFINSTSYTQGETVYLGTSHKQGPFMAVVELE